jgi:hypothetical protein
MTQVRKLIERLQTGKDVLLKTELVEEWEKAMIERARDTADLAGCISGSFVSLCLQKIGTIRLNEK